MVEGMRFFHKGPRGKGSAKRSGERGKSSWSIRVLPDEGGVQHGAEGFGNLMGTPPVVTQGVALIEQNSYEPRPAGWEEAKHPCLPGGKRFFF